MPFQLLPDTGPEPPRPSDFGLLIIRIITVAIFFYYQHVAQMALGIDFVWDAGEWDLVTQLTDRGLPSPAVLALVSVVWPSPLCTSRMPVCSRPNTTKKAT